MRSLIPLILQCTALVAWADAASSDSAATSTTTSSSASAGHTNSPSAVGSGTSSSGTPTLTAGFSPSSSASIATANGGASCEGNPDWEVSKPSWERSNTDAWVKARLNQVRTANSQLPHDPADSATNGTVDFVQQIVKEYAPSVPEFVCNPMYV